MNISTRLDLVQFIRHYRPFLRICVDFHLLYRILSCGNCLLERIILFDVSTSKSLDEWSPASPSCQSVRLASRRSFVFILDDSHNSCGVGTDGLGIICDTSFIDETLSYVLRRVFGILRSHGHVVIGVEIYCDLLSSVRASSSNLHAPVGVIGLECWLGLSLHRHLLAVYLEDAVRPCNGKDAVPLIV